MYVIKKLWLVCGGSTSRSGFTPTLWAGDDKGAAEAAETAAIELWRSNPDTYCAPDARGPRMEPWLCAVRFDGEAAVEVLPFSMCAWETYPGLDPFVGATLAISRNGESAEERPAGAPLAQAYGLGSKENGFAFPIDVVLTSSGWHECQYGHWVAYDGLLFGSQTAAQREADRLNAAAGAR